MEGPAARITRAARYCPLQRHAAARNLCPRTLPASVAPAAVASGAGRGRPGRTQPPCGHDRTRCREIPPGPGTRPGCGRAGLGLPGTPISTACCCCHRAEPERRTESRADESAQRTRRFDRRRQPAPPPGSTWPLSRASLAANQPGAPAPSMRLPCECRLPAGLTGCDGIGMGLRARSACHAMKV
jgi:hypothetical protein